MTVGKAMVFLERDPRVDVLGAYSVYDLGLNDLRSFFRDHPAEDFVSLELMPREGSHGVRVGMMNPNRLVHGTFACIPPASVTVRGFYQSGHAAFLTGKRLSSSVKLFRPLFDGVIEALLGTHLASGQSAKHISFHGRSDTSLAFDGLSWRSMIPTQWMPKSPGGVHHEPSARIIGVMDNIAYALSMELERSGQDPETSSVNPYKQRVELHQVDRADQPNPAWKRTIIEHARPLVRGVGFMARLKTPAPPDVMRPRSGYMPLPDSIFSHITYVDDTFSTITYYPGASIYSFSPPSKLVGWTTPPTVLAVVRPNPKEPARGLIVQESLKNGSCLLHYLAPEQVPEPYRPYLESLRP